MPQGHYTPPLFSPTQGALYITVTQGTSPSGVAEVCDQYLFCRAKTGSLAQATTTKKLHPLPPPKKTGITRPRPDRRVIIINRLQKIDWTLRVL